MYFLILGELPFDGVNHTQVLKRIDEVGIIITENHMISQQAIELISKMLEKDILLWISAIEVFNHEWVINQTDDQTINMEKAFNGIWQFYELDELRSDIVSFCFHNNNWNWPDAQGKQKLIKSLSEVLTPGSLISSD